MRFIFLGTGSAFTTENFQTNMIIEQGEKNLLIDAGGDVRQSMKARSMSHRDIDSAYITHLHFDHSSGFEWLGFATYFDPECAQKIKLYGEYTVLAGLWRLLEPSMSCIQQKQMTLEDYFDVQPVLPNRSFEWQSTEFNIVQSVHVMNRFSIVHSYGLMFTDPLTLATVYYTGDTQFNPNQIMDFYKEADLVIQDCETSPYKSGVHANYLDLITLPDDVKARMLLVHYQDNVESSKERSSWKDSAKLAGFTAWDSTMPDWCGFIACGAGFSVEELMERTAVRGCV
jgi:ribonuclease BN (tRNA processing enzyme)